MNCPQCGDVCRCLPEPSPTASARWMSDAENHDASVLSVASPPAAVENSQLSDCAKAGEANALPQNAGPDSEVSAGEGPAWRDELSARLDRYRARRKPRPPRYPSLSLRFDAPMHSAAAGSTSRPAREFETASNQALALDGLTEMSSPAHDEEVASQPDAAHTAQVTAPLPSRPSTHSTAKAVTGKILEFPRFAPPRTST